jgi:hypothetical protein
MQDEEEKECGIGLSQTEPLTPRLSPLHSMSARLKHMFPLARSRSSGSHPPVIVTPEDSGVRSSTSSADRARLTHLHVVNSSAVAAAVAGTVHFEDNVSVAGEPPRPPQKDNLFAKLFTPHFRRTHRRKNNSVSSIPDSTSNSPMVRSAPSSPKLSAQSAGLVSTRSSNEDRPKLDRLPLPALQSSESLPPPNRPFLDTPSELPRPRVRSSTISSVSSDVSSVKFHPRRVTSGIFNIKGRESGRATPVEKPSLDIEPEDNYTLPPTDSLSGEEYLQRLSNEEGGLPQSIPKLVESSYFQLLLI